MKKKKNRFSPIWYILAIAVLIVFLLFLISSVLTIGEKLEKIHKYVEYVFYGLMLIVVLFGIVNPIRIIVVSPSLSIITTLDDQQKHKYNHLYKKVAKNIVKNNDLNERDKALLTQYKNVDELRLNLQMVFDTAIKKELNSIIIKNAKTVMISTAISQNSKVDMVTVFSVNLNMIKELVQKCGFRPSMKNLSKLTLKVMTTALIADGIESVSLDDVLPQSMMGPLNEIPMIKPVMSSITQGIANGLLTLRIGTVTRKYLFKDGEEITKESIRRSAWKESIKLLPTIVSDTFTFVPKKIVGLFRKDKKKDDSTEIKELEGTF